MSILLPVYLAERGFEAFAVGAVSTATLLGSALLMLWLGLVARRTKRKPALLAASLLMAATGIGFATVEGFWPFLIVAFVGTLKPSGGDVSVFLPLEHMANGRTDPLLIRDGRRAAEGATKEPEESLGRRVYSPRHGRRFRLYV